MLASVCCRRHLAGVPARRKSARVCVEMHLTRAEIKEIEGRAHADRRAIVSDVGGCVAHALDGGGPRGARPAAWVRVEPPWAVE